MEQTLQLSHGGRLWFAEPPQSPRGLVLICPGGGYQWLSPREAGPVADAFKRGGWAAAVLDYLVRETPEQPPLGRVPLEQLTEAVCVVRERMPALPVAVCGFSAGANLAGTLGVHWHEMVQAEICRPDALILCYPVVTMGAYTHAATADNLTGGEDRDYFSLEKHVTAHMPATFLWHTIADQDVPVQNSLLLAQAMLKAGVPYEMHLYPDGVHGLSLATPEVEEPAKERYADTHVATWFGLCLEWLDRMLGTGRAL